MDATSGGDDACVRINISESVSFVHAKCAERFLHNMPQLIPFVYIINKLNMFVQIIQIKMNLSMIHQKFGDVFKE